MNIGNFFSAGVFRTRRLQTTSRLRWFNSSKKKCQFLSCDNECEPEESICKYHLDQAEQAVKKYEEDKKNGIVLPCSGEITTCWASGSFTLPEGYLNKFSRGPLNAIDYYGREKLLSDSKGDCEVRSFTQ